MLVGPMKRKVVLTGIFSALIPIIIIGVVGFFIIKGYNQKITTLTEQSKVVQKYVLKEDTPVNHIITENDIRLSGVKNETTPGDAFDNSNKAKLIGRRLKISAKANTILAESMFYADDKIPTADLRLQEFNMIALPSDLVENDYIDVRVRFSSGEDYSVLVGKKIESYTNDTIFIKLTEDEILTIGSAIIEAYILDGTKLYANKYIDPANQLFETKEVDYVRKYDSAVESLLASKRQEELSRITAEYTSSNPDATEEEIASLSNRVSISENDLPISEIANRIGLSEEETTAIRTAKQTNNSSVLNDYRKKTSTVDKKIAMTYPVKANVLSIIKTNPNILDEIKENFDTNKILAERMTMQDTQLTGDKELDNEKIQKIKQNLTNEIQTQKEERVNYLKSLLTK